jgi:hypothetical protein
MKNYKTILWVTAIVAMLINAYFTVTASIIPGWVRLVSVYGYLMLIFLTLPIFIKRNVNP